MSNYVEAAAPSTFSALSTFGDHLFGSRVYFCGRSTNSACALSVSSSVGLGGRRFFYFLCIVRDPQRILGRPDRCSCSTEPHRFVVVRFHGPHRIGMELSVAADNPVSVWSGRGWSGTRALFIRAKTKGTLASRSSLPTSFRPRQVAQSLSLPI